MVLAFFLLFPCFGVHLQITLAIMSQICLLFSEPHAAILNDALQGSPRFVISFKLDDRNCAVSDFHFSFPAAVSKTRRTSGSKLWDHNICAINKLGHLQKFYSSFEQKQTQLLRLL